jgi:hypothetical protein
MTEAEEVSEFFDRKGAIGLIFTLRQHPETTQQDLRDLLVVSKGTLNELTGRAEQLGLIKVVVKSASEDPYKLTPVGKLISEMLVRAGLDTDFNKYYEGWRGLNHKKPALQRWIEANESSFDTTIPKTEREWSLENLSVDWDDVREQDKPSDPDQISEEDG